ncbi:hypothetical protein GCM10007416_07920 [Kroppenstedtia guangzhouensis]|uniref:Carrier domain-containing protein n=1 Tax=Kroppenstedtia guangzhouensis TaxID=1274356 RepID=A0ABQ1G600_9BACL|nr:non-ribosomal peptide synthetase [Kroppenstedtia guangzhouensis]GGA37428.1 hypothetical protein GCM10007416_07920 [Kroppenstedtia guangzhouensis]
MARGIVTEDLIIVAHQKTAERRYWLEQLAGELADGRFPSDYWPESGEEGKLASVPFFLDATLSDRLKKLSNHSDLRLFMVLTAGLTLLLNKYTGLEDILVGAPVHRQEEETDLINTMIILRQRLQENMSFKQLLMQVRDNTSKAIQHQNFPLITLRDRLDTELPEGRSFPFRIAIVLEELQDLSYLEPADPELVFSFRQKNGRLEGDIHYRTGLFHPSTVERLGNHYAVLLAQALRNPDAAHVELDWITDEERVELASFNDTSEDDPHQNTLVEMFDNQAKATPDTWAVVGEEERLTYAELKRKANRVATSLRQKGIGSGHIVGLLLDRSPDMIIALLGVLKAGAAYLPISSKLPTNRVQEMLEDCASPLLITPEVLKQLQAVEAEELPPVDNPQELAYVIFTSGSTGKPKGTMIEHKSVVNFVWGMYKEVFSLYEAPFRAALVSPFEFDASIQLIFGTLLFGHTLYIVPEEARLNGALLLDYFRRHQVQITDGTPTHLRYMMEHLQDGEGLDLLHLIIAGEALPPKLAKSFLERFGDKKPRLTNAYGPTEVTVNTSCFHVSFEELDTLQRVPIGTPLINLKAHILGPRNQLQPIGVPGELCITGHGLARGYLNRPELNQKKFPTPPWVTSEGEREESRMYRTGDLVRWLPDGNLDYLGRLDDQVKIHGMRIEPGEIENRLLTHPAVREAVVIARKEEQGDDPYLCAYLVLETPVDTAKIRRFLAEDLPYYMVPSYLITLEKLPVTANGKLDRKALPAPVRKQSTSRFEAPRNETEKMLAEIWCQVLGVEKVGIHDSFFELGGNSLQVTAVVSRIKQDLGVDIPFRELFIKPTLLDLATCVQRAEQKDFQGIRRQREQESYPVSSAQKRLYVLNRFQGFDTAYNIPGVLLVEGSLDMERLEATVQSLVRRHESLRTWFRFQDGQPVQVIQDHVTLDVERFEAGDPREVPSLIRAFIRPFDLTKAPLMRVGLISIRGQESIHYLLFDLHHIIADGVSLTLLEQEFFRLYKGETLEPLNLQYKDYALWQRERLHSEEMKKHQQFWLNRFSGEIPVLQLPTDFPRPLNQSFEGDRIQLSLPSELWRRMQKFAEQYGVTLYMFLLAAYNVLLHRYTQQEDIIVGTPIAGRLHSDQESMVGVFVNTLAMRNYPSADKKFTDLLRDVKENAIEAYQHQEYPFEELVDRLNPERDLSRNPLFDTMLVLQNITRRPGRAEGLKFTPHPFSHQASKVDITLEFYEEDNGLLMAVEYATRLYKRDTMERFARHFLTIVDDLLQNPHQRLQEIAWLDDAETQMVLEKFNETAREVQHKGLVHQLLERRAAEHPGKTALIADGVMVTYGELNARANRLARRLRELQVGPEERIGLMLNRSAEMVIAVYAVMKAGGAYLPIDPEDPADRIRYLLEDSGVSILLTETKYKDKVHFAGPVLDLKRQELYEGDGSNLTTVATPDQLAYILYTSGSTGQPKGVMVEHRSIVNYLYAMQEQYPMTSEDAFLLKTPYTFDVSVIELFGWTLTGARLVVLEEGDHRNPKAIIRAVTEHRVRLLNFVPSMFKVFLNALGDDVQALHELKYLLIAGEVLSKDLVQQFCNIGSTAQLHNLYGPTEATVIATSFPLSEHERYVNVPIGRPIANVRIYILDPQEQPVPIGVVGELYIAGASLARGYLNNKVLTDEKFRPDPFVTAGRMYRTGDLARWLPDGHIEFFGRIDRQVKIRGFRIELGEVESLLTQHDAVTEAVVIDQDDSLGNKQLIAYYVPGATVETGELKTYLSRFLPSFMVPARFQPLTEIPRTSSGKIDRQSLPEVKGEEQAIEILAGKSLTESERKLVELWRELLNVEQVGIDDDFFELGGNSLLAVELDLALEAEGVRTDDLVVYEHRTIRSLLKHIESRQETEKEGVDP